MENLWAPWRKQYISNKPDSCPFCEMMNNSLEDNYVVAKTEHGFITLNKYPYNAGHLLIVSVRHVPEMDSLSDTERNSLFGLLSRSVTVAKKVLKCDGYNIGVNAGKYAGAGITDHLHLHLVPRWIGDTNFMPAIAATKVISLELKDIYNSFKEAWDESI